MPNVAKTLIPSAHTSIAMGMGITAAMGGSITVTNSNRLTDRDSCVVIRKATSVTAVTIAVTIVTTDATVAGPSNAGPPHVGHSVPA